MLLQHSAPEVPGYRWTAELFVGKTSRVYRAIRRSDEQPVVVKLLSGEAAVAGNVARLVHEYDVLNRVRSPFVIRPLEMLRGGSASALILEDIGGTALSELIATSRLDIGSLLQVGIHLASALSDIHEAGIVHKDVNPSNIIINRETLDLRLADFGIASILASESAANLAPESLEGTLAYLSPEQTGRMNRSVDYRTDFYSLGITLYELLVGWRPFQFEDPLALLHAHIARVPAVPSSLNPAIPATVSAIVMKLLAKTAEERYQSAAGLGKDLLRCRQEWREEGRIRIFQIGASDVSTHFRIPEKLYGREEQTDKLLKAFENASAGGREVFLVSGGAGIGKTALVNEVHKSIVRSRGYFVAGKFDRLKRDVPYAPLVAALRDLIIKVLSGPEQEVEDLRQKIRETLGANGKAISWILPEIDLIVGEQPALQNVPPGESQVRFHNAMVALLRAVAGEQHPLVLFLDDLQWADRASLDLLGVLLVDSDLQYFLMIGSYRDEEIAHGHPLCTWLESLEKAGYPERPSPLPPLSQHSIASLLGETLHEHPESCASLATIVQAKTGGNPYFVNEYLRSLYHQKVIRFDAQSLRWNWDESAVLKSNATDNIVALLSARVARLPDGARMCLERAACIGVSFSLSTLSETLGESPARTAELLWPAVVEGLVIPQGEGYRLVGMLPSTGEAGKLPGDFSDVVYRFAHDRVRQAAYDLLSVQEAARTHLHIGRYLSSCGEGTAADDVLFESVNHLNLGASLIDDRGERRRLLRLNSLAAARARRSAAFDAARGYCTMGMSLARPEDWNELYDVLRDLLMQKGECEYLTGSFEQAIATIEEILARVRTPVERARALALKVDLFIHISRLDDALAAGIFALRLVGVRLSTHPSRLTVFSAMAGIRLRIRRDHILDLDTLPVMTEDAPHVAINLLVSLFGIAYSLSSELAALVVTRMVGLTLRHGIADVSGYAFCIYGMIVRSAFGSVAAGRDLASVGVKIARRFGNTLYLGRCNFVIGCLHNHWYRHARTNAEYLNDNLRLSMESGDQLYASYAMSQQAMLPAVLGTSLSQVAETAASCLKYVQKIHHDDIAFYFEILGQFVRNLKGETAGTTSLESNGFSELHLLERLSATRFSSPLMYYHAIRLQLCVLHGNYEEALKAARASLPVRHTLTGQIVEAEFVFFHALALAGALHSVKGTRRRKYLREMESLERILERWARTCPENYSHRALLVSAERAWLRGRYDRAMRLFDEAIETAGRQEYFHHQALANERAGRLYLERGMKKVAVAYLEDAWAGYREWGATAKQAEMESSIPEIGVRLKERMREDTAHPSTVTGTQSNAIDLLSVLKASQALSGEIVVANLLEKMMTIVLENAGAERGYLVVEHEGRLFVEAELVTGNGREPHLRSVPLDECADLPARIVRTVAATRETIVSRDASLDPHYGNDPYVSSKSPRSILCMPIFHQGKVSGVLYLENNLAPGVFTPARLEVLRLLSSQIGVSLENARLYESERRLARMDEELRVAAAIQGELLPKEAPVISGYALAGKNIPAQLVGGDYFDFIEINEDCVGVAIGDISGKGLPASLLMANLQATLRGQAQVNLSPAECIRRSNRLLFRSSGAEKFATVFYGVLDFRTHRLSFCNGGHEFPLLLSRGVPGRHLEEGGPALAMLEDYPFSEQTVLLSPGDLVVMCSDGITEAMNPAGEMFGRERLEEVLRDVMDKPIIDVVDAVVDAVRTHAAQAEQSDDITLVAFRRFTE